MKISGRIKALIAMAVVIYVLGHVVRAMVSTLMRPGMLLHAPRSVARLTYGNKTAKRCGRC